MELLSVYLSSSFLLVVRSSDMLIDKQTNTTFGVTISLFPTIKVAKCWGREGGGGAKINTRLTY